MAVKDHYIKTTLYGDINLHMKTFFDPISDKELHILFLHGLGQHAGLSDWIAGYYTKNGYTFSALSLPGHGQSAGKRGDIGSFSDFLAIVHIAFKHLELHYPKHQFILYGHSLGATIALAYLSTLKIQSQFIAAIISAPWLTLRHKPTKAERWAAQLLLKKWPSVTLNNRIKPKHITPNKSYINYLKRDKEKHRQISPRLFFGAENWGEYLLHQRIRLIIPTIILHGTADKITSPEASYQFYEQQDKENLSIKILEGVEHEIHANNSYPIWLNEITEWIDSQTNKTNHRTKSILNG